MKTWLKRIFYSLYYYQKKVKFHENVVLNVKNYFEGANDIAPGCHVVSSSIGYGTYIADNSTIKFCKIGRFCSLGSNIQTGLGMHPAHVFVSTHPAFFSTQKQAGFSFVDENGFGEQQFIDTDNKFTIEIGNDVWIGTNAMILDGVKIGDGAIVSAGAIITKDVKPYSIVAGAPGKIIGYRFTDAQIEKLLKIKWWNWAIEDIRAKSDLFNNIETFVSSY